MANKQRLIGQVANTVDPTIPRSRLLHGIIEQLNRNTLALSAPRDVGQTSASRARGDQASALADGKTGELVDNGIGEGDVSQSAQPGAENWVEVERSTSTVRVENPDDSNQYVDVDRINTITFSKSDGTYATLIMNN